MDMAAGTGDGRRLRSADWFGEPGRMGAIYRSWVRGYTPEVFDGRPVIGIADSWSELTPCNAYLRQRAADWHTFRATLPQRVAGVLATAAGAGLLTATAANPGLARLVGPATATGLAWRLGTSGSGTCSIGQSAPAAGRRSSWSSALVVLSRPTAHLFLPGSCLIRG